MKSLAQYITKRNLIQRSQFIIDLEKKFISFAPLHQQAPLVADALRSASKWRPRLRRRDRLLLTRGPYSPWSPTARVDSPTFPKQ